jgi:hypothetical protein
MPRDKSKSRTVLGKPHRPTSSQESSTSTSMKEVRKGSCADCQSCDISATGVGYCENHKIKKILESWDGVLRFPQEFGCMYHS